jgi:hypothetical protein
VSEHDFQIEVIDRLGRIEERLNSIDQQCSIRYKELSDTKTTALSALQSTRSAHHRINGMYIIAGAIGSIISFIVSWLRGQ